MSDLKGRSKGRTGEQQTQEGAAAAVGCQPAGEAPGEEEKGKGR